MTDFIEGENRFQATLFPERLDDYIADNSHVRVVNVFILYPVSPTSKNFKDTTF